jgi:hypothetical protein
MLSASTTGRGARLGGTATMPRERPSLVGVPGLMTVGLGCVRGSCAPGCNPLPSQLPPTHPSHPPSPPHAPTAFCATLQAG